jgi:predicted O-methyltransferase YrrM
MDFKPMIKQVLEKKDDTDGHLMTMFSLVLSLNAKNVLELGVRAGNSTKPLLDAVQITGGTLTSVDIDKPVELVHKHLNNDHWKFQHCDSLGYLRTLPDDEIFDLVLVDDWHDGLHALQEIELLDRHVTTKSIILLHDTMCPHTEPEYHLYDTVGGEFGHGGPYRVIKELNPNRWEWSTIPVSHGLTMIRKKKDVEYSLILTTHKNPGEATRVLRELEETTAGMSREIIVIGHEESDKPQGQLPMHDFYVQPNKGCANSVWYGAHKVAGRWFVWLCDDHLYPDRIWLARLHAERLKAPGAKVIKINAQGNPNCVQIGAAELKWYKDHYPMPVYDHYGWDDEVQNWSVAEGMFHYAEHIVIKDIITDKVNMEFKRLDVPLFESRKTEFELKNGIMARKGL